MSSADIEPERRDDRSVLSLVLEQNKQAPALARAAISAFCENRDVPETTLATVTLLVSEVVTNAVTHPDVEQPTNVRLLVRLEPQIIRVEVTDDGSGFEARPRDPSETGSGFGLSLLEHEAVRWGVDKNRGSRVWFEVALDKHD
jgi:anti-sigma regulatory factor (Ser/Thr protein kinase)